MPVAHSQPGGNPPVFRSSKEEFEHPGPKDLRVFAAHIAADGVREQVLIWHSKVDQRNYTVREVIHPKTQKIRLIVDWEA